MHRCLTVIRSKKVLVVGGTIREVLKHPSVEKVVKVEIDDKVFGYSKQYHPQMWK
ncbi:hypothetical protein [Bacillus sp. Marseille-P3661]|uniref:spermine/spermidine synthase domain-containing protein n=1 Tax=Bacillus sp. Marseille-P3661 TaxID=1936234 RepID=UPI000C82DDB1|nr:hypothetical protein [Bacillus sp. Marseille-P3661]